MLSNNSWGTIFYKTYGRANFTAAKEICAKDGSSLPLPKSGLIILKAIKISSIMFNFLDEENEFISGLNQPDLRTWLNIANINGEYVASDGTPLQYTNWQRNEPKNKTGSEYGQDTHLINLIQSSWSNIT